MNIKDLIEAVKFQVSVKPQDDFMREVAEGLEKLYSDNMKLLSDYDAACDELKKWQKLQPIGCPACHRGCFSNDKFCPHCGTSLRNSKVPTEKASGTGMTDNEMIKYLRDHGLTNGCSLGHHSGTNDLIADRLLELLEENNCQNAEIERLTELLEGWKAEAYKVADEKDKLYCEAVERVKAIKAKYMAGDAE